MASPYLERPRRSLQQALVECGRSPSDAGIDDPSSAQDTNHPFETLRQTIPMIIMVTIVLATAAVGVVFVTDRSKLMSENADDNIWNSNGVVPASGPNTPVKEDNTFANPDAPPMEFGEAGSLE